MTSVLPVAAALACGVTYLAADYSRKIVPAGVAPLTILLVYVALQIPVLAVWAWVSGDFAGLSPLQASYWGPGLADAALGLGANLLYLLALRRSPLSMVIPLLALIPAVALLTSGAMLGEWPSALQGLGIALVVTGLLVLYGTGGIRAAARNLIHAPGVRLMGLVVVLWSLTPSLDKLCVARSSVGLHGLVQVSLISLALAFWMAVRHGRALFVVPHEARPALAATGVLGGLGYCFQLAAYHLMLVASVELIKRVVGMAAALIVGRVALDEPLTRAKIAGVGIIAAGLPLVLLS